MLRQVVLAGLLVGACLLIAVHGCVKGGRDDRDFPNILIITADDMGPHTGRYGDHTAPTPNLDRLADEGVLFTRAYVTQASCSPSRSSILTGLYPHQNGQLGLANDGFSMDAGIANLPTVLHGLGFFTGAIGKIHVAPESDFEFDYRVTTQTRNPRALDRYFRHFVSLQDSLPFLFIVNLVDPHKSRIGYKNPNEILLVPADPLDGSDVEPFDFLGLTTGELRRLTAGYYNCVMRADFTVGLLVEQLRNKGLLENTVIVFLSDHGPPFTRAKTTCYEAGLRIPFIVKWPGISKPSQVRDELVSTVDILPTILDELDIDPVADLPGESLIPLLKGKSIGWRETLCAEFNAHRSREFYPRRSIRDDRYKLILNLLPERANPVGGVDGCPAWAASRHDSLIGSPIRTVYDTYHQPPSIELYDLLEDPNEFTNLADDPRFEKTKQKLLEQLQRWRKATRDPYLDRERLKDDTIRYVDSGPLPH